MDLKLSKLNKFDNVLIFFVFLNLIVILSNIYGVIFSGQNQTNPFNSYYSNSGIFSILISYLITSCLIILSFLFLKKQTFSFRKIITLTYIISILTLAVLKWYELYYGSTFYYGEVRDKQGLNFPVFSSLLFALIIWKINYHNEKVKNFIIKITIIGLLNIGLLILWGSVYESWNLHQS